jgi:hypothetical protein
MTKPYSKVLKTTLITTAIILLVGILAYNFPFPGNPVAMLFYPNLAEEVAKPIEKALVEAGAVKLCESGSNGKGMSNNPRYLARFESDLNHENILKLLGNISKEEGFANVSPVSNNAGTSFIDATIPTTDNRLETGNIEFLYAVNVQKHFDPNINSKGCTLSDGEKPGASTFLIQINLPSFKR